MHWRGHWWGTEIVADTKEDEAILKKLAVRVGKKPLVSYECGELETSTKPDNDNSVNGDGGGYTLVFNR